MENMTDKVKKALAAGERVVIDIRRGKDIEVTVGDDCGYEHMDVEELTLDQLEDRIDEVIDRLEELRG